MARSKATSIETQETLDITVVIPTHNRSDALDLTIEHLSNQDFEGAWEAIVVNNNSTDDTDQVVKSWQEKFPVKLKLVHESKPGPAAARNVGAGAAKGRYLVFIDNDILTGPDFLRNHMQFLDSEREGWFIGRVVNPPELRRTPFGRYRDDIHEAYFLGLPQTGTVPYDGAIGANWAMRRDQFFIAGGFDESYSIASCEDAELALRARKSGFKTMFNADSRVVHNDWAIDLKTFLRRQETYSISTVLLWTKYGEESFQLDVVTQNGPINIEKDGFGLALKKSVKGVFAARSFYPMVIRLTEAIESMAPDTKLSRRSYEIATSLAIFRGVREGFLRYTNGTGKS